jgi:hypothetical protein
MYQTAIDTLLNKEYAGQHIQTEPAMKRKRAEWGEENTRALEMAIEKYGTRWSRMKGDPDTRFGTVRCLRSREKNVRDFPMMCVLAGPLAAFTAPQLKDRYRALHRKRQHDLSTESNSGDDVEGRSMDEHTNAKAEKRSVRQRVEAMDM